MASGAKTGEAMLAGILAARSVNLALGGAFVTPMEADALPDDFLDACEAVAVDVPRMARQIKG